MIWQINPVSKPRQTVSDRWKQRPCVMKYRAYADELRTLAKEHDYVLGESLTVVFVMPMPKSWSKKKRLEMRAKPHQQRPDLDNLCKAFMDALAKEDSHVWRFEIVKKVWGKEGNIIIYQ